MADISTKPVASTLTNDVKTRAPIDALSPDMPGAQFTDVMSARFEPRGHDVKNVNDTADAVETHTGHPLKNLKAKAAAKTDKVEQAVEATTGEAKADATKVDVKEKIKARINEITSRDDVPVKDDRPLKALQKVAKFLIQADRDGTIDLPPELLQKMQDFLAKGDTLQAADIAAFMRDFSESFKTVTILMNRSSVSTEDGLKWPPKLVGELKDLNMGSFAQENKDVSVYDAVRLLKALVNAGEKAALETLTEKADTTAVPQDRADLLVNSAAKNTKLKNDATTQTATAASIAAEATPPAVIGKGMAQQASSASLQQSLKTADAKTVDTKSDGRLKDVVAASQQYISPQATALMRAQAVNNASGGDLKPSSPHAVSSVNQTINLMEGVNGLTNSSPARFSAALSAAVQTAANPPSEATQQVIVQLQQRGGKSGSLSVQLTPVELGRVDVRLTTQRDGSVHTVIAADRPETLALLQKDAALLERSLQQAGINANTGNMSFNLREQRQSQQFDQGRKRFARGEIEDTITKDIALNVNPDGIFSNDRVNYHA